MNYKCVHSKCNNIVDREFGLCHKCSLQLEKEIIRYLSDYLSDYYKLIDNYEACIPHKIVDYQKLKHGIRVSGYSKEFLKKFYCSQEIDNCLQKITDQLIQMKKSNSKLFDALKYLWGKQIKQYECDRSTVYRRLKRTIRLIATGIGLLETS